MTAPLYDFSSNNQLRELLEEEISKNGLMNMDREGNPLDNSDEFPEIAAVYSGGSFVIDHSFNTGDDLRALADRIDSARHLHTGS